MKTLRTLKNNTAILRTLFFFFTFGLITAISLPTEASAGFPQNESKHRIALKIYSAENSSINSQQLDAIRQIGIDLLEVSFPTSLNTENLDQFYLLLDSNLHFTTEFELKTNGESMFNSLRSSYNSIPDRLRDNIAAVKVFDFPADYRPSFPSSSDSLLLELSASFDKPLFYRSAFSTPVFSVKNVDFYVSSAAVYPARISPGPSEAIFFEPSQNDGESLRKFETILNQSLDEAESLIIIPADWFLSRMESQKAFSPIISSYLNGETVDFPMPISKPVFPQTNWAIILLMFIWASFIIHYKHQPMYKATLPRYFFSHSFFVHDILQSRMRNATSAILVLLQHSVMTGFFFYLLAEAFITKTGLESLAYHYSAFIFNGYEKFCLFILGMIIAAGSHVISVAWLHLLNKKLRQLSQAINLYSWPFHLNLVILTIAVYFLQVGAADKWILVTACLYFLVWFSGFTIAAIDGARFIEKFRALNLFLTVGLHFLLLIAILILIFSVPGIFQPLEMAFMLP